jgi:hypothetical protein
MVFDLRAAIYYSRLIVDAYGMTDSNSKFQIPNRSYILDQVYRINVTFPW